MWYHCLTQGHLTKQIYAETHLPIVLGAFQKRACTYRRPCIIYKNVDTTEPIDRPLYTSINLIEISYVNEIGYRLATVVIYLSGQRLQFIPS